MHHSDAKHIILNTKFIILKLTLVLALGDRGGMAPCDSWPEEEAVRSETDQSPSKNGRKTVGKRLRNG